MKQNQVHPSVSWIDVNGKKAIHLPEDVQTEKDLIAFLHSVCGTGFFMVMVWSKHRKRSPDYSEAYKKKVPVFFDGMLVGIQSQYNGSIYKNKIAKRLKELNPDWREKQEEWKERF